MPVTCLIADDSTRFISAATRLFEADGIAAVGVASTASSAVARAEETRPDVPLVDVNLGEDDGFDVAACSPRARTAGLRSSSSP
jgi:CheY-like chemotaxis protein